jgi:hypothetical protein
MGSKNRQILGHAKICRTGWGVSQVVEHLLSKCKAEFTPSTAKKKKKKTLQDIYENYLGFIQSILENH